MARRSTLAAEENNARRRSSTTDDRLNTTADSSENGALQRPSLPGTSRSCPIEIDDGEDADHTTTPVKPARRTAASRDDPLRLRPSSAQKPRSEQPKTPGRDRPQPQRDVVSDPGLRRPRREAFQDRPIAYVQNDTLPCGRKRYSKSGGACHEKHRRGCQACQEQPTDQPGGEESGSENTLVLPTRTAAGSGRRESDSVDIQAHSHSTVNVVAVPVAVAAPVSATEQPDNNAMIVHHRLLQAAKTKLTTDEKKGYLYILSCTEHPGLLKVGCSIHPYDRKKQHKARCGLTMTLVHVSNRVLHMKRAEKLAKLDLVHLREPHECPACLQTHGEFFKADAHRARLVADRWVDWINHQTPYATDGSLAALWEWLLDFRRAPRPPFAQRDHAARWAHWDAKLLPPSREDAAAFVEPQRGAPHVEPRAVVAALSAAERLAVDAVHGGNTYNTIINNLVVSRDFVGHAA